MVSPAGMSAAYGGFQSARKADQEIDQGDITTQNARLEQEADTAVGNAIRHYQQNNGGGQGGAPPMPPPMGGGMPPPGPQPPMPGQPSVPRAAVPGATSFNDRFGAAGSGMGGPPPPTMSPSAGPAPQTFERTPVTQAPQPQQQGFQGAQGGPPRPQFDFQTLTRTLSEANPGINPAVLAKALNKLQPVMNAQALLELRRYNAMLGGERLDNTIRRTDSQIDASEARVDQGERRLGQGEQRLQQGQQRVDQQAGEYGSRDTRRQAQTAQGEERTGLMTSREKRLALQGEVRADQRMQQLQLQRDSLEQRIRSGDTRASIVEWKAAVDAEHKRAKEIIMSARDMSGDERKKFLAEQDKMYTDRIKNMKPGGQGTKAPGAAKSEERVPAAGTPPAPVEAPPPAEAIDALRKAAPGSKLNINGVYWVLDENGQPQQVPGKQSALGEQEPRDTRPYWRDVPGDPPFGQPGTKGREDLQRPMKRSRLA